MARTYAKGTTDRVEIADDASMDVGTSNSVYAWIYLLSFGISSDAWLRHLWGDEQGTGTSFVFRIGSGGQEAKKDKIGINISGGGDKESTGAVSLNVWTWIAMTMDGTNARFYIDGALDSTVAYSPPAVQKASVWEIGSFQRTSLLRTWDGRVAWVGYHPGVTLTLGELLRAQRYGWTPRGIKALYGYDLLTDLSGNGRNGTATGTSIGDEPPIAPAFGADLGWAGISTVAAVSAIPNRIYEVEQAINRAGTY